VLKVVTRSRACYLGKAKNPNASILEMLEPLPINSEEKPKKLLPGSLSSPFFHKIHGIHSTRCHIEIMLIINVFDEGHRYQILDCRT
jgi:hypothetical protein